MGIDAEALAEVDMIIQMMPKEENSKIPNGFKNFIKSRKSNDYIPNIKEDIPLYQQDLKKDTKTICSLIYRSYLCSKDRKMELENNDRTILLRKEQELREKYNPDNIFKNRAQNTEIPKETTDVAESTSLVEYKEEKWYQKIFRKIFNLFKRKNY